MTVSDSVVLPNDAPVGARLTGSGKIKTRVASTSNVALSVVLGVLAIVTVYALVVMDYGKVAFFDALAAAASDFATMMLQPGLAGHFTLPDVIEGLFVSLALAIRPEYLLLDEAFDGLDPLARLIFKRGLAALVADKKCAVIISSHSLRELEDISDSYGLLDHKTITCSGDLEKDLEKIHKFQAAFDRPVAREELGFDVLTFSFTGRVVQIVAKGNERELAEKLQALSPLFVEEIPVDFEELFVSEVESRGYLQ